MYTIVREVLALLLSFLTYRYYFFLSSRDQKSCLENPTMYRSFWSLLYIHFLLDRTILRVYYYLLVNSRIYVFIMYPPICAHKSDCTHTHCTVIELYWILWFICIGYRYYSMSIIDLTCKYHVYASQSLSQLAYIIQY